MTKNQFTTGQVSGITRVPVKTMQRYISQFRQFFSPGAGRSARGRIFTNADILTIFTIRNLYGQKARHDKIASELRQNAPAKSFPEGTVYNQLAVNHATSNYMNAAKEAATLAEGYAKAASYSAKHYFDRLEKYHVEKFDALNARVIELEKQVIFLLSLVEEEPPQQPERKSALERLLGL